MKKIIIAVVALLVLGGGGAAAFFLLQQEEAPPEGLADQVEEAEAEPDAQPLYLSLDPAFVINYEYNGSVRYLQISLQAMAYEPSVLEKVAANMPAVRNKLIMLFSGQDYPTLNTVEGKEALRVAVVESINEQLRLRGDDRVRDVFYTGFVVQ